MKKNNDIIVVGSGLIGLFTAYFLAKLGLLVTIIEKKKIHSSNFFLNDIRTTAISEGTKIFLDKESFWNKIKRYAEPIEKIKVFDRNQSNELSFINENKKALGYIIKNKFLLKKLIKEVLNHKNIQIHDNAKLENIQNNEDKIIVQTTTKKFFANLLVAADGKNSFVRNYLKETSFSKNYNQNALVINFLHEKKHNNIAYEIFSNHGPLATLPMKKHLNKYNASSMVWSHNPDFIQSLNNIKNDLLLALLNEQIEDILGKAIRVLNKQSFTLSAHLNNSFISKRITYVGDSAHSLHPIAGQGWNVGMRDVEVLLKIINNAEIHGLDIGSDYVCNDYQKQRYFDAFSLYQITDKLNSFFMLENYTSKKIRQFGFNLIKSNKNISSKISNYAMGFSNK